MAHEDVDKGGLGCPSLQVEYHKVQVQRLTAALNDPGPVGHLTRARMNLDKHCLDAMTIESRPALTRYSLRIRQQLACHHLGIELLYHGQTVGTLPQHNGLLIELDKLNSVKITEPPALLLADLHALRVAGITTLQDTVP